MVPLTAGGALHHISCHSLIHLTKVYGTPKPAGAWDSAGNEVRPLVELTPSWMKHGQHVDMM